MNNAIETARQRNLQRAEDAVTFFDDEAADIEQRIIEIDAEIAEFRRANDEALPGTVTALRTQLAALETSSFEIDRQISEVQANAARVRDEVLTQRLSILEDQKRLIARRIAEIEANIARAPDVARGLAVLERRQEALQEQFAAVQEQRGRAEFEQLMEIQDQSERLVVLEEAVPAEYSFSRSRKSVAVLGILFSGFLAVAVGYLLELLNPAIRSAAQLERRLGITPVISIPVVQRRTRSSGRWTRRGGIALTLLAVLGAIGYGMSRILQLETWTRLLPRRPT